MPDQPTLAQFRATMLAAGYDEVLERVWAPDTVVDTWLRLAKHRKG